ncbi:MAG: hypothetical protein LUG93_08005 [Lachnospiraceae bacterium]|nr:hypothetical protein [Lachnospiraceae bacterium]
MDELEKYSELISEEQKESNIRKKVICLCAGITLVVCVTYSGGAAISSHIQAMNTEEAEAPRLVILGKESEETIAVIAAEISQADGSVLSLEDFLDKLICGACSRKCPLIAPRCKRGKSKAEIQTAYYEQAVELLADTNGGGSDEDPA